MERMTLAQATGEHPIGSPVFVAGDDFDPRDSDDVEHVRHATGHHAHERIASLERENAHLRKALGGE